MIETSEEFIRLRNSDVQEEYNRAALDEAPTDVWWDVLATYPNMAFWVAQNKTIPYEVLEHLANHTESRVRSMVAMKNKLKEHLLCKLAKDSDNGVRMMIARHKKATLTVLSLLTDDQWAEVSKLASERVEAGNYL